MQNGDNKLREYVGGAMSKYLSLINKWCVRYSGDHNVRRKTGDQSALFPGMGEDEVWDGSREGAKGIRREGVSL